MLVSSATVEQGIRAAGVGKFQYRLFVIFGLVWMADAMQVLAIGFSAPSIAKTFGIAVPKALQSGTFFFIGMLAGAFVFGAWPTASDAGPCCWRQWWSMPASASHRRSRPTSAGCWCCAW
jgi:hypothetical protein